MYNRARRYTESVNSKNLAEAALKGAQHARELLLRDMNQPKSGTMHRGNRVPSSSEAKGETPAIQTGELIAQTRALPSKSTRFKGEAYLDSAGKEALFMEFGWTAPDGQVHYRPFHRTFVAGQAPEIQKVMRSYIKK